MQKSLITGQIVKHRITIRPSNSISKYKPKKSENRGSKRHLHTNVHCSIIHNSQKWNQMSIKRRMGRQNMAYPYNGLLFSHKKNKVLIYATTWMKHETSW